MMWEGGGAWMAPVNQEQLTVAEATKGGALEGENRLGAAVGEAPNRRVLMADGNGVLQCRVHVGRDHVLPMTMDELLSEEGMIAMEMAPSVETLEEEGTHLHAGLHSESRKDRLDVPKGGGKTTSESFGVYNGYSE